MPIYNGIEFNDAAPTTFGFPPGHVFAVSDPHEVLYECLGYNAVLLEARPVASPALNQVFTQAEFRQLVKDQKVDPRIGTSTDAKRHIAARNTDIEYGRDLPDDEREALLYYTRLARLIQDKYEAKLTSKTDDALRVAIAKAESELHFGVAADDPTPGKSTGHGRGTKGRGRNKAKPKLDAGVRRISARKSKVIHETPSPTTVRDWIRLLIEHDWDELAIRDHRKGRCGNRAPRITEPLSLSIMAGWVRAYIDRNRPTMAVLHKLMIGAVDADEVNDRRGAQGKAPLAIYDIETFAEANAKRESAGLPNLPIPSKSTFERAINKLPKFEVCVGRHGIQEARRRFKIAGKREAVMAAGERVALDSWRFHLKTVKMPGDIWAKMPDKLAEVVARVRLNVTAAICEATKVTLGVRFSANADGDTVLRTLEMVCRDKTPIAQAAGCRSTWSQACSPEAVPTDSGPENIDASVRWAIRDIGAVNMIGPAEHPDARAVMERFFGTADIGFSQFFQGRTFASIAEKGDYDPAEVANVIAEVLQRAFVRWLVDVYLISPHGGLGGQTPNDAWIERTARFGIVPPPTATVIRNVFGFSDNRRIQNDGIRFLGRWYRSERTARLRLKVGQGDVRIRADLQDCDVISVCENKPGARWFSVPCDTPMDGASAEEWLQTAAVLRRKFADAAKLHEHVVLSALRDIRAMGLQSALAAGIGPSTMSRADILKQEELHFRHFGIVPAETRGLAFEDDDIADGAENAAITDVEPIDEADGDGKGEQPVVRRRGRLGSDFLGED